MALSRAFTTRKLRLGSDGPEIKLPQRSNTTSKTSVDLRHKISAPLELVHTTNMLSYNAPDLPRPNRSNSSATSATSKSGDESDRPATADSTPPTSPDVAPGEKPGDNDSAPQPNHLSTYFIAPGKPFELAKPEAPVIPKRSPSHTKRNSEAMIRQRMSKDSERSVSTKASFTFSRSSSTSTRASSSSHMSSPYVMKQTPPPMPSPALVPSPQPRTVRETHPFGKELAQVTEMVEEISVKDKLSATLEDEQYMVSRGLVRHCAADYLSDIQSLSSKFFAERSPMPRAAAAPMWI